MIKERKNQNISHKAFTLIEMMIVLLIMGIILLFTVGLSGQQIQKVKNKAVKESILAEMQMRYSRNLWSSSFSKVMYSTMDVKLAKWENKIDFVYNARDSKGNNIENTFTDFFEIKYLWINYIAWKKVTEKSDIALEYSPYKISCKIWDNEKNESLVIITRVNNNKDYCFEIKQKNCRLTEMSEMDCDTLKRSAWIENDKD